MNEAIETGRCRYQSEDGTIWVSISYARPIGEDKRTETVDKDGNAISDTREMEVWTEAQKDDGAAN